MCRKVCKGRLCVGLGLTTGAIVNGPEFLGGVCAQEREHREGWDTCGEAGTHLHVPAWDTCSDESDHISGPGCVHTSV